MTKMISWNVNGLRACAGKGFEEIFKSLDADLFSLQETKLQEGQIDMAFPGWQSFWNYAEKKGYSGTAVFTKKEPLDVLYGIGAEEPFGVLTTFVTSRSMATFASATSNRFFCVSFVLAISVVLSC